LVCQFTSTGAAAIPDAAGIIKIPRWKLKYGSENGDLYLDGGFRSTLMTAEASAAGSSKIYSIKRKRNAGFCNSTIRQYWKYKRPVAKGNLGTGNLGLFIK
jgi:hypothetical protein